jgi:hypothetical protein
LNWKSKLKKVIIILIVLIFITIYIYRPQPILSEISKNYISLRYYDWDSHTIIEVENNELESEIFNYLDDCKMRFANFYKSEDNDTPLVKMIVADRMIFLGRWKYVSRNGFGYRIIDGDKVLEDIKEIINKYESE